MERYKRSSESLSAYVSASAGKTRRSKVVVEEAATGRVWRNEIGCEFVECQIRLVAWKSKRSNKKATTKMSYVCVKELWRANEGQEWGSRGIMVERENEMTTNNQNQQRCGTWVHVHTYVIMAPQGRTGQRGLVRVVHDH